VYKKPGKNNYEKRNNQVNKTILVVIDGLRSDAVEKASTPALDFLISTGASCMTGRTIEPPLTLPAHFSIFASLPPHAHGVLTNTGLPDMSAADKSLFAQVKHHSGSSCAFFSWDHLRNLSLPGNIDFTCSYTLYDVQDLMNLAKKASHHIVTQKPDFTFVYLEWADIMGHLHNWMSDKYLGAVEACDKALGLIVDAVHRENRQGMQNFVVMSDHGGNGQHHRSDHPDIMTIPFIAWGKNIRQNHSIKQKISVMDAAPTIAKLLDIPAHQAWEGSPINEIFHSETTRKA